MIVAKPLKAGEQDLLQGNEQEELVITNGADEILLQLPAPEGGWTHALLDKAVEDQRLVGKAWDAYLFGIWIGSSEV